MTAFNEIRKALESALRAAPAIAGGNVHVNRVRPIPVGESLAVVIRLEGGPGSEVMLGTTDWATRFTVECYGRAAPGGDPVDVVDPLLSDTWARIQSIAPASLGAMSLGLNPAIDWQYDEVDVSLCAATFSVVVQHGTFTDSLTARP